MNLRKYVEENMRIEELAFRSHLSFSAIRAYLSGTRIPSQKAAERIEFATNGMVTVKELRGKDARKSVG